MADYGTKYTLTFYSFFNRKWVLNLKKLNYIGSSFTVTGGASPVILSHVNEGEGKFVEIKGTEMSINLYVDLSSLAYDFADDFSNISDREWIAELNKEYGAGYTKTLSIDTLNITNTGSDATGTISILNTGNLVSVPTCDYKLGTINVVIGAILTFYAVPYNEDLTSPNAKELFAMSISTAITKEDVVNELAALPNVAKVDAETIRYTQSTYDADIDNTYHIKVDYTDSLVEYSLNYLYRFTGSTVRAKLSIDWYSVNKDGSTPTVATMATYYFTSGETENLIASNLQSQLDGFTQQNVFLDASDANPVDIDISASVLSDEITLTLNGLFADGNGILINSNQDNSTHIRVYTNAGSNYIWDDSDFTGGSNAGDQFLVELDTGITLELAETRAYVGDTISTIMSRLNQQMQNIVLDSVLDNDDIVLSTSYSYYLTYQIRFTTDGGSTTSPSTYASFDTGSLTTKFFQGWIIPALYSQPNQAGIEPIELKATCGIGDLKNVVFEINESRPFEKKTYLDIISICLQNTEFNLGIVESFELFPNGGNETDPGIEQVYQDTSRLNGRNCYDVLKEILNKIKGAIYQRENNWIIRPLNLAHANYTERYRDYFGNLLDTVTKSNFIQDVGGTSEDNNLLNRAEIISNEPAFKKVIFNEDYGLVSQIIKFPNFSTINSNLDNLEYPWDWVYSGATQESGGKISLQDNILRIEENSSEQHTLQQSFNLSNIDVADTDSKQYELSIRFKQSTDSLAAENLIIRVQCGAVGFAYYLQDDDENDWIFNTPTNITITANENNKDKTYSKRFDYPFGDLPPEKETTIYVYQPTSGYIQIESIEINANISAISGVKKTAYYQEKQDIISSENYEESYNLLDVPNISNAKELFKNALFLYDSTEQDFILTNTWDTAGGSYAKSLLQHLREFYLKEYSRPIKKIDAEILGELELGDIIKEKTLSDTLFYQIGGDWDIKKCILTGEWEEYNIDDSGLTLINETAPITSESAGTNTYTTIPGDSGTPSGGQEVDLSNYPTNSDLANAIEGNRGTFLGSQLTNRAITINHNLGFEEFIFMIFHNNIKLKESSYNITTNGSTTNFILNILVPYQSSDVFKYRIL